MRTGSSCQTPSVGLVLPPRWHADWVLPSPISSSRRIISITAANSIIHKPFCCRLGTVVCADSGVECCSAAAHVPMASNHPTSAAGASTGANTTALRPPTTFDSRATTQHAQLASKDILLSEPLARPPVESCWRCRRWPRAPGRLCGVARAHATRRLPPLSPHSNLPLRQSCRYGTW